MQVILLKDVKGLGKKGQVVNASDGHARNYLIPKGLAAEATSGNVNQLNKQKEAEAKKKEQELQTAQTLGKKLEDTTVQLAVKSGEGGRLFGSVNTKDIADILEKKHNLKIDKRKIELKDSIKALGTYTLTVKLHPDVHSELKVTVTSE